MNRILSQWIQCEFKGVIFFKILISEFYGFFKNLFWFFTSFSDLFYFIKYERGGVFLHRTHGVDVAWAMTCKATWQRHANPHADVARARGKATRVHADT